MSFWSKISVTINDLEMFKNTCDKNNVEFIPVTGENFRGYEVHARLQDNATGSIGGYLVKDGGAYRVMMDRDGGYSRFANRLGGDVGKLTQDYTVGMIDQQVRKAGGIILDHQTLPDGSILLRAVGQ
jgi:hypothetical protein